METKEVEKVLESSVLVRFPDCDPFNHLNNSRYIDYVINAREDQLIAHYGLDIYALAKQTGVSWVVSQTQIAYFSAAELMEQLTIQTQLIAFGDKHLIMEAIVWNAHKTEIKAITWIHFTHFNLLSKRSHQHSDELMQLFHSVYLPIEEKEFDARIRGFRNSTR